MHKICGLVIGSVFVFAAFVAVGQRAPAEEWEGQGYRAPAADNPAPPPAAPAEQQEAKKAGQEIVGTVTKVDRRHGWLSLRTDQDVDLTMTFPPRSVRHVQPGDRITARMSLAKVEAQEPTTAYDLPLHSRFPGQWQGEQRINGVVTHVDQNTGIVDLSANKDKMRLQFAPDAVKNLNAGAKAVVDMAFTTRTTATTGTSESR